jgi:hypothetical protein
VADAQVRVERVREHAEVRCRLARAAHADDEVERERVSVLGRRSEK